MHTFKIKRGEFVYYWLRIRGHITEKTLKKHFVHLKETDDREQHSASTVLTAFNFYHKVKSVFYGFGLFLNGSELISRHFIQLISIQCICNRLFKKYRVSCIRAIYIQGNLKWLWGSSRNKSALSTREVVMKTNLCQKKLEWNTYSVHFYCTDL